MEDDTVNPDDGDVSDTEELALQDPGFVHLEEYLRLLGIAYHYKVVHTDVDRLLNRMERLGATVIPGKNWKPR